MFAFLHQHGIEAVFGGIVGEGLEIYIEPIEWCAFHLLVLHLEIDFALVSSGKGDQETAVFVLEEVAEVA